MDSNADQSVLVGARLGTATWSAAVLAEGERRHTATPIEWARDSAFIFRINRLSVPPSQGGSDPPASGYDTEAG
jgi:hypothetical protein